MEVIDGAGARRIQPIHFGAQFACARLTIFLSNMVGALLFVLREKRLIQRGGSTVAKHIYLDDWPTTPFNNTSGAIREVTII